MQSTSPGSSRVRENGKLQPKTSRRSRAVVCPSRRSTRRWVATEGDTNWYPAPFKRSRSSTRALPAVALEGSSSCASTMVSPAMMRVDPGQAQGRAGLRRHTAQTELHDGRPEPLPLGGGPLCLAVTSALRFSRHRSRRTRFILSGFKVAFSTITRRPVRAGPVPTPKMEPNHNRIPRSTSFRSLQRTERSPQLGVDGRGAWRAMHATRRICIMRMASFGRRGSSI